MKINKEYALNTHIEDRRKRLPKTQRVVCVLWPSFLAAGIQTIVFFTLFDPDVIFYEYNISRLGAYTVGFFTFWFFAIIPCLLTLFFAKSCKPCIIVNDDKNDH